MQIFLAQQYLVSSVIVIIDYHFIRRARINFDDGLINIRKAPLFEMTLTYKPF